MADTKKCPFCAEEIKANAIRCKHCRSDLSAHQAAAVKKQQDEDAKRKREEADKRNKKILVWIIVGIFTLFFWYIAIPALIVWYLILKTDLRKKLAPKLERLLQWAKIQSRLRWKWIAGAFVLLIIFAAVRGYYAPSMAAVALQDTYSFTGDNAEVTGRITTDCRCTFTATFNGEPLQLDAQGAFTKAVAVPAEQNESDFTIALAITGEGINKTTINQTATGKLKREQAILEAVEQPQEWEQQQIALRFNVLPDTQLELNGEPTAAEWAQNGSGALRTVTIKAPFDLAYTTQNNSYKIAAKRSGYAPTEMTVTVKNIKYDGARVAKEESERREQERVQRIVDDMDTYTGNGSVQIAIQKDITKSRTVGYRYVLDPDNYQFIRLALFVKNVGFTEQHANPNYVTLVDSKGRTYNPDDATYGLGNYFDATDLQPNTYTSGWLAFIVPKAEKELTLVYSSFSDTVKKEFYVK